MALVKILLYCQTACLSPSALLQNTYSLLFKARSCSVSHCPAGYHSVYRNLRDHAWIYCMEQTVRCGKGKGQLSNEDVRQTSHFAFSNWSVVLKASQGREQIVLSSVNNIIIIIVITFYLTDSMCSGYTFSFKMVLLIPRNGL